MILGLNLSHESSVAITDNQGVVIFALEEERLSRQKGHHGFPFLALRKAGELFKERLGRELSDIVVGSSNLLDRKYLIQTYLNHQAMRGGTLQNIHASNYFKYLFSERFPPSTHAAMPNGISDENLFKGIILNVLGYERSEISVDLHFVKHHDGHLGCGVGVAKADAKTLLLSLDGEGDGESGVVSLLDSRKVKDRRLVSSNLDSLGNLYAMVTHFYGFKSGRHEGKITGLAAYGKFSEAAEILANHVAVVDGTISLRYIKSTDLSQLIRIIRRIGLFKKVRISLEEIIDASSKKSSFFPDLAYAMQSVLEVSVCEIVDYWARKFDTSSLALAGGVFANVKLNQRISELPSVRDVRIFPNMGDGGLSLGGIWHLLAENNTLSKEPLFDSMFLLNESNSVSSDFDENKLSFPGTKYTPLSENELVHNITKYLNEGKFVGLHQKGVEFGPRALGNRSILFDARRSDLGTELNRRLKRTEFMPFAPLVLREQFEEYMQTKNNCLQPFEFMTMTCYVREDKRQQIPAVVHVDGTARPQIVQEANHPFLFAILKNFFRVTGVPVLVNTSLNMHEEPINFSLGDSIRTLLLGGIDVLAIPTGIFEVARSGN